MKDRKRNAPLNQKAVALFYDKDSSDKKSAPVITAKGERTIAEEIIAIAQEHNIPIFENPGLASLLHTLEIGDEIPAVVYVTIAEIIAFAYSLKQSG